MIDTGRRLLENLLHDVSSLFDSRLTMDPAILSLGKFHALG
jgi:hypothetical protein